MYAHQRVKRLMAFCDVYVRIIITYVIHSLELLDIILLLYSVNQDVPGKPYTLQLCVVFL